MTNDEELYEDFDLTAIHRLIFDGDISGWQIEKETGFSRTTVARLRNGKTDFEKLTLKNLLRLKQFIGENK